MMSTPPSSLPCACSREAMTSCRRRRIWRADAAAVMDYRLQHRPPPAQWAIGDGPHRSLGGKRSDCGEFFLDPELSLLEFLDHHIIRRRSVQFCPKSEEHTSELQSLMRISYAVFCLTKK